MKNIILTILISITTLQLATANNNPNPVAGVKVVESSHVDVYVGNDLANLFSVASYNVTDDALEFEVGNNISYIQIFDADGQLEFQLPVLSKKVKIGKSLFSGSGDYKLGFMIDGEKDVKFSDVQIR